ncbi:unnamed protein product [Effrenium voratum]|nr:unnamed protein product [Effrenium voratum]
MPGRLAEMLDTALDDLVEGKGGKAGYGPERRKGARRGPYEERQERQERARDWDENFECRIPADADVNRVAGRIAHGVRRHATFVVVAAWDGIWTALKAIARARVYLEEDAMATWRRVADWQTLEKTDDEMVLELSVDTDGWMQRAEQMAPWSEEKFISSTSEPAKSAGAAANGVRKHGACFLSFSGPEAAQRAFESLQTMRRYLEQDWDGGRDIAFAPRFGKSGNISSVLYVCVFKTFCDCQVSSVSDVHLTAGYLAAGVRENCPPVIRATGLQNVNLAVPFGRASAGRSTR